MSNYKIPTNTLLRQIAGSQSSTEIIGLLKRLSDDVADVRTPIIGSDNKPISSETRVAISNYFTNILDTINRIGQNEVSRQQGINNEPVDDDI